MHTVKVIYWDDTPSDTLDIESYNDLVDFYNDGNVYKVVDITDGRHKVLYTDNHW